MQAEIVELLRSDSALELLLTGGVYDAGEVVEISRQDTPPAFNANCEILPCLLVKLSTDTLAGPVLTGARLGMTLYFYQRYGYQIIDLARLRTYELLHRVRIQPVTGGAWEVSHAQDLLNQKDDALDCSLIVSRYVVPIKKG